MLRFEQLPDEMIELIVDAADLRAKKRFSLVNRRMRKIAVSFMYGYQDAIVHLAKEAGSLVFADAAPLPYS